MFSIWEVEKVTVFMKLLKDMNKLWENQLIGVTHLEESEMFLNLLQIRVKQIHNGDGKLS